MWEREVKKRFLSQREENISESFSNVVTSIPGCISIKERQHMWGGVPNALGGLRLRSIREERIVDYSHWWCSDGHSTQRDCPREKTL